VTHHNFHHRDIHALELMEDPHCDPALLQRTYAQFSFINAVFSGWRTTYRRFIKPSLSRSKTSTLLDIGSGAGDIPRALIRWAARDKLLLTVLGIDPDERAQRFATAQPQSPQLGFRTAFSSDLVGEGAQFDFVISNHVLHHLTDDQRSQLLTDSELLSTQAVIHTDIARSRAAYIGFAAMTLPFAGRSFTRTDGLTSIRRSYTPDELANVVPITWRVQQQGPFRIVLSWKPSYNSA
jgi:2-polyprenyl-3-methyl-5-hydroxy-6-metoxy-1,4-benzoquinol methylase